jgi:hypothetical protein
MEFQKKKSTEVGKILSQIFSSHLSMTSVLRFYNEEKLFSGYKKIIQSIRKWNVKYRYLT